MHAISLLGKVKKLISETLFHPLLKSCKIQGRLLLLGDFNMDMYHKSGEGRFPNRKLADFCQRFCLVNKITEPTRVRDKTMTLIDVALTSHPERYATAGTLHFGVSDHNLVFVVRKNNLTRPNRRFIEYRSIKSFEVSLPFKKCFMALGLFL